MTMKDNANMIGRLLLWAAAVWSVSDAALAAETATANGEKDGRPEIAVFGGSFSCIGPSEVAKRAWTEALGCKVVNYGAGGMGFLRGADRTNDIPNQVRKALAKGGRYAAFVLWASTNDINYTVDQQNEAIEWCVREIREKSPASKVLFFASMPCPLQPERDRKLAAFAEGQRVTCAKLGVPCLDQYRESGFTADNAAQFCGSDRFHPNEAGYAAIAKIQVSFLLKHVHRGLSPAVIREANEDWCRPVRPGDPEKGVPFWNVESPCFIYPPAFDFREHSHATTNDVYQFTVYDRDHKAHVFTAPKPWASLAPIWNELPVGQVTVICEGLWPSGVARSIAGMRVFWKSAPFDGIRIEQRKSYAQAAKDALAYLLGSTNVCYMMDHGHPDRNDRMNGFPSKMHGAIVSAMVRYARLEPKRSAESLEVARRFADFLIRTSEPAGRPLADWPQTYTTNDCQKCVTPGNCGKIMLLYPAEVGMAYLDLAEATGEAKWREAAERIAATYLKTRRADGTWPLMMRTDTGRECWPNTLVPDVQLAFMRRLYEVTGDMRYRKIADECLAWIDAHPLKDWAWEAQFEDQKCEYKYQDLQQHNALSVCLCLLHDSPDDARRRAEAHDLVRYAEDQFVFWEKPLDGLRKKAVEFMFPRYDPGSWIHRWHVPCVVEQYACFVPVNASAAKTAHAFAAYGRTCGSELCLAKARALANRMVDVQQKDGYIPTWNTTPTKDFEWINCHVYCATALYELHCLLERDDSQKVDSLSPR